LLAHGEGQHGMSNSVISQARKALGLVGVHQARAPTSHLRTAEGMPHAPYARDAPMRTRLTSKRTWAILTALAAAAQKSASGTCMNT
jgi:hypothetical protein